MVVKLYNTLTRKKEYFKPLKDMVGFYACGPTVYDYAHLGNLRSYLFMDLLHRTLRYNGFKVHLVMNITDVGHLTDDADQGDDKIEASARKQKKSVWQIAEYYTRAFLEDINSLNIIKPQTICKATDHIKEQIDLIKLIEKNGYAYITSDGVYFDTSKLSDYGKLIPNFDPEQLMAGKRVELGEKKNITDFALWKFSPKNKKRAMEWDSPWGVGFPGWHIECTAMACHYLGRKFDIHTGGIDHIPVHHTNEIAQAQAAFGEDHVRYWLHNEFLTLADGQKMAKSAGNFLRLKSIVDEGFHPLDYRYLCLLTHYRKQLNYSHQALVGARNSRLRLLEKVRLLGDQKADFTPELSEYEARFSGFITDDLNLPEALAVVFEMLKSDLSNEQKLTLISRWDEVLGLDLTKKLVIPDAVISLVYERERLRKAGDYQKADLLREEINKLGFSVSDSPDGPVVSELVKNPKQD